MNEHELSVSCRPGESDNLGKLPAYVGMTEEEYEG